MKTDLTHWLTYIKRLGSQNAADKIAEKFRKDGERGTWIPGHKERRIKKRAYVPGEGCGAPTPTGRGKAFRDGTRMAFFSDGSLRTLDGRKGRKELK